MHGDPDRFNSSGGFLSSLSATMKESEGRFVGDPAAGVRSGGDPLFTHPHERSCGSNMDAERFFVVLVVFYFLSKKKERKKERK